MKYYPLTAAQRMHNIWIHDYGTQQVSGISIVAALKTSLDFSILKKSLLAETERYGCLRVRFTKPDKDGEVNQYLTEKYEEDILEWDLSDLSVSEADEKMQNWAYETFDGDDISMCEFRMVRLPDGFNGFFVHLDHRLIDSVGLVVMVKDIFELYLHFGLKEECPEELADYVKVLEKDFARTNNEKRRTKDKNFWDSLLDQWGEPLYSDIQGPSVLQESRKRHGDDSLRAADIERENLFVEVTDYKLEAEPSKRLVKFCSRHQISMTNVLLFGMRTYLSKVNDGQEDITIDNFISRRSTRDEMRSGGSRTICFPCRTVISPDTEFLDGAYEIQNIQNRIYLHGNYDPEEIREEIRRRYHTPAGTDYVSCYLTYQPFAIKTDHPAISHIPFFAKWFANGAATKKVYLTVTHTDQGEMNFSYHYQTASLEEHDVELFHYYLMRILFTGIENPQMSVGEIMATV